MNPEEYLFPILPFDTPAHRMHRVKNDKIKWFNKRMSLIAKQAGITKSITSYSARDTWTNIGLDMGIDIRQISSALGHSSVSVTDKHYGKVILEKILDDVNNKVINI
jgi:integrase